MGAWGYGPLENDSVLDWSAEVFKIIQNGFEGRDNSIRRGAALILRCIIEGTRFGNSLTRTSRNHWMLRIHSSAEWQGIGKVLDGSGSSGLGTFEIFRRRARKLIRNSPMTSIVNRISLIMAGEPRV